MYSNPVAIARVITIKIAIILFSDTRSVVQDIAYAISKCPNIPQRMTKTRFTILVTGTRETGKTTTLCNLFASIAPSWAPASPNNVSETMFNAAESEFEVLDKEQRLAVTYQVIVRLGTLKGMLHDLGLPVKLRCCVLQ